MSAEPIAVAVGLLLNGGRVLMGERKAEKIYPLHWEFPGGKVEPGETPVEALLRELREELLIEILDADLWETEIATYSNGITYGISYFVVRAWEGDLQNQDFNRIEWISQETLPTLLHLSGNAAILERLMLEGIPS